MASQTPFYPLPLYETGGLADLRDGYNAAMRTLDRVIHQLKVQEEINHPTNLRKDN
nr:MAG TPA: hypothetical protein [Bacteriophage sp.]